MNCYQIFSTETHLCICPLKKHLALQGFVCTAERNSYKSLLITTIKSLLVVQPTSDSAAGFPISHFYLATLPALELNEQRLHNVW